MVTSRTLPSASYGRNTESPEPGVDQYQVLFQSEDFPALARRALEQLATSVQWAGGGPADIYDDCYALWPLTQERGSVLVARLMDAGCDRLGRPHALRVDAVYVESSEALSSPSQLGEMMSAAAWPNEPWSGPPESIELEFGHLAHRVTAALERAAAASGALPRTLVVHHSNFRADGFDVTIDLSASAGDSASTSITNELSRLVKPVPPRTADTVASPRRSPSNWLRRSLKVMLALGLAAFVGLLAYTYTWYQLDAVGGRLSGEILAHRDTKQKLVELQRDLELERAERAQQSKELEKLQGKVDKYYVPRLEYLEARLQALQADKPENEDHEGIRKAEKTLEESLWALKRDIARLESAARILINHRGR